MWGWGAGRQQLGEHDWQWATIDGFEERKRHHEICIFKGSLWLLWRERSWKRQINSERPLGYCTGGEHKAHGPNPTPLLVLSVQHLVSTRRQH